MKQYLIAYDSGSSEHYVSALYKHSISSDSDIADGIKCDTLEEARGLLSLCTTRSEKAFYVVSIETTVSKVTL